MFQWMPSGATPDYLRMYIWYRESKDKKSRTEYSPEAFIETQENVPGYLVDIFEEYITPSDKDGNPIPKKDGSDSKRKVKTKVHHLPYTPDRVDPYTKQPLGAVDVIFDTGSKIFDTLINQKRVADGYTPIAVGPYYHGDQTWLKFLTLDHNKESWWMASAHYLKADEEEFCEKVGIKMCADSGGAQTKFRTANFVDPYKVIKVHNACAHTGMALDLATRRDSFTDMDFEVLPEVQKIHNDIFVKEMIAGRELREKRGLPPLKLLNVVHGMTGEDFRGWYEAVKDENFSGWAVSLDSDVEDLCLFRGCAVLYEKGIREEQVHLFGVSGPNLIPAMAWLSRFLPNLTSDSSSWIEGGRRRTYFYNDGGNGKLEDLQLTEGDNLKHNQAERIIGGLEPAISKARYPDEALLSELRKDGTGCKCVFCNLMGTLGGLRSSEMTYTAMVSHNIVMIKEIVDFWNNVASEKDMTLEKYLERIAKGFGGDYKNRTYKSIKEKVEYVDYVMQHGPEEADKKFSPAPGRASGRDITLENGFVSRNKTNAKRANLFKKIEVKRDPNTGLIFGLSEMGSNMELLGLHLTDEELGSILSKHFKNFDKEEVIKKLGKGV